MPGPEWENFGALREYAQAVYAASDAYVGALVPEALDQCLSTINGAKNFRIQLRHYDGSNEP
ncbi:MAG: hypothetical protein ACJ8CR_04405 [Roseiflexaceae bacterium]